MRNYYLAITMRFTPTCVGTLRSPVVIGQEIAVHPHMRGDTAPAASVLVQCSRFTPTCVGTL